jgi:alkylhydroperoxidase/carboxymuconolactone decarboxylase family protein YurZ
MKNAKNGHRDLWMLARAHAESSSLDEEARLRARQTGGRPAGSNAWLNPSKGTFMATGDAPVLDALLEINATGLNRAELDPATMLLVRIAALAAVDAPATSYLMHVGPAVQAGVTIEQVQDVLVTVAPIIGAPRVLAAAQNITDALGIVIAIQAADVEAGSAASG